MKKTAVLLVLVFISTILFSQNQDFVYSNGDYGVEIKFPAKPVIIDSQNSNSTDQGATLILPLEGGLSYNIVFQKTSNLVNYVRIYKNLGGTIKSQYKVGKIKVTEMEVWRQGSCHLFKIVESNKPTFVAYVTSQTCAPDKYVMPFFNSLKINGTVIQNPNTDNSKYTTYSIDYPSTHLD